MSTVFINETYGEPEKEWLRKFLGVLTENKFTPYKIAISDDRQTNNSRWLVPQLSSCW